MMLSSMLLLCHHRSRGKRTTNGAQVLDSRIVATRTAISGPADNSQMISALDVTRAAERYFGFFLPLLS
jgi:hypothetical protein